MKTVDDYMDAARAAQNIKSDRELARRLGFGPTSTNQWRTKRAWPADETMIRLAELAGVDPAEALLDLNTWRSDSPLVRSAYERIAAKIASTAAAVIVGFSVAGSGAVAPADAAVSHDNGATVYYGKYMIFVRSQTSMDNPSKTGSIPGGSVSRSLL